MEIFKYRYDEKSGMIVALAFARQTKTQLIAADGSRISKTRGYGADYYDSYEACRVATLSSFENQVKAAKELLDAKRTQLRAFRELNPKQGR